MDLLDSQQPKWGDLDVNQHVNNVKYIGWILEVITFPHFIVFSQKTLATFLPVHELTEVSCIYYSGASGLVYYKVYMIILIPCHHRAA